MYLDFYNLKEKPFSLTPDPAFLYYSMAHKRAIAFLKYGLQESKGFLQLTGPVGSGKTTLLRAVLSALDEKTKTAYIMNPSAPFPDLLRSIMKDLEIPNIPISRIKTELLDFFHDYLLMQARRGNRVVVIFDEAQNLSIKNLEEIRMLSNFETTKEKLIQIIFVGQPELVEILDRQDLRQLKQRIQVRYNLAPLRLPEVKEYINHRLYIAGSSGELDFTDEACDVIYRFSGGIPRLINSLCDVVLLIGYVSERKLFEAEIVEEAIREISGSFTDEAGGSETVSEPSSSALFEPGPPEGEDTAPSFDGSHLSHTAPEEDTPGFFTHEEEPADLEETQKDATSLAEDPPAAVKKETSEETAHLTVDDELEQERGLERPNVPSDELPSGPIDNTGQKRGGVLSKTLFFVNRITGRGNTNQCVPDENPNAGNGSPAAKKIGRFSRHLRLITSSIARMKTSAQRDDVPVGFINPKVMILCKENRILKGIAANLDLSEDGFSFMNIDSQNGKDPDFVPFENIIAARLVNDLKQEWESRKAGTKSQPRGRQILVTLINGEVIEGITLDNFDSCCKRFFVVSPGNDGDPSWILVERTGSAGILMEQYSEGIYAEEYEALVEGETDGVSVPTSDVESKGDFFFGIHNFEAALKEYQKEVGRPEQAERLQQKISLSRLNLGIKHLKENNYSECRSQLEKITNGHLPENTFKRVAKIREFLHTVTVEWDSFTKERNTDVKN